MLLKLRLVASDGFLAVAEANPNFRKPFESFERTFVCARRRIVCHFLFRGECSVFGEFEKFWTKT